MPEGWAWARMSSLTQDLPYGTSKKSSSRGEIALLVQVILKMVVLLLTAGLILLPRMQQLMICC